MAFSLLIFMLHCVNLSSRYLISFLSVYFCCLCVRISGNFLISGEMPIEELMKMYSAAENESTDLQTEEESSQESSDEGGHGV